MTHFRFILSAALLVVCFIYPSPAKAATPVYSTDNIAIKGYDVVAYFLQKKAIQGQSRFSYRWHGVEWHFANQKHRDLFIGSPESYQPMFGGFCGLGAAHGALVYSDPQAWTMHQGRLILNQNKEVTETWRYNPDTNIERANANYKKAVTRYHQWQAAANARKTNSEGEK